jgi:hypothetical protein
MTKDQAKKQAARLMANPALSPQSMEGKREIVDCLLRHCGSEAHAAKVITEFLDTATDARNVTAELATIAHRVGDPARPAPRLGFAGCVKCDFTGWKRYEKNGYTFGTPCECRADVVPAKPAAKPASDWALRAAGDVE